MRPVLKRVSPGEREWLARELGRRFRSEGVRRVVEGMELVKLEGRWTEYFDASRVRVDPGEVPGWADPFVAGVPVCERSSRGGVRVHLEGVRVLAEEVEEIRVYVRERSAVLFTYGRDVLPEGVVEVLGPEVPRLVAVMFRDELGEHCVGVGRLRFTRDGRPMVDNVIDRGWYLRRGG